MSKDNILFSIIGLLLGVIIGFALANSLNQRAVAPAPAQPSAARGTTAAAAAQPIVKAANDQPDNFEAQMRAAESYYQARQYNEAIEFLERANRLRPGDYQVIVGLGNAHFDAGRYEEAERWYTAALEKNPNDVSVRTDLGLSFFFREPPDVDRAIKEYRASLDLDPLHVQTLQNLTVALIKKGDASEAEAVLAKLESINPANPALQKLRSDLSALRASRK